MRAVRCVTKETGPAEREDQMPGVRPVRYLSRSPSGYRHGERLPEAYVAKALLRE